jgi:hypothetical protein
MRERERERKCGDMSVKLARINDAYCYVVVTILQYFIFLNLEQIKRQYRLFVIKLVTIYDLV